MQQPSSLQQRHQFESYAMPSQERSISSSTDLPSGENCHQLSPLTKIPYKKACDRPAVTVARRNARERKRVHTVNQMFNILKCRLPSLQHKTKRVSKLKILKASMDYIYDLQDILDAAGPPPPTATASVAMATVSSSTSQRYHGFEQLVDHNSSHNRHHHRRNFDSQVQARQNLHGDNMVLTRGRSSAVRRAAPTTHVPTYLCDSSGSDRVGGLELLTVHPPSNRDPPPLMCFHNDARPQCQDHAIQHQHHHHQPYSTIHHYFHNEDNNNGMVYDPKFYHCDHIADYGNQVYQ